MKLWSLPLNRGHLPLFVFPRDAATLQHPQIENLYPCAEGAGYAGGIVSAAMDGEKVASQIAAKFAAQLTTWFSSSLTARQLHRSSKYCSFCIVSVIFADNF